MDNRSESLLCVYESPPYEVPVSLNIKVAYAISKEWWNEWCEYSGYETSGRGPMPGPLKFNSKEDKENVLVSKFTWKRFKEWYGLDSKKIVFMVNGYPDFCWINTVISCEGFNDKLVSVPLWFMLSDFKDRVMKKMKVNRFCKFYMVSNGEKCLLKGEKSLQDLGFFDLATIFVKISGRNDNVSSNWESIPLQDNPEVTHYDPDIIRDIKTCLLDRKYLKIDIKPLKNLRENLMTILEQL